MPPRFDPAASLRIWAVEVTVGGRLLRVPPLPAADWLPSVMTTDPLSVVDLLEDFDLAGALLEGDLTISALREGLIEIVEAAAGRSAVAAFAIAGAAADRWDVIGADVARAGVRFGEISLGAALDALYGSIARHMDEKGVAEFNRILESPTLDSAAASPGRRPPRGAQPLPASAEQYVRERPKTQRLPRPDRPGAPTAPPTGQSAPPADSGRPVGTGPTSPAAGGGSPQAA